MRKLFLETERLYIVVPTLDDFDLIQELCTDKEVMHFIGDGSLSTPEKTRAKLEKDIAHFAKHGFGFGLVFEKKTNLFVGQAGLFHLEYNDQQPKIEVGYRLHKACWGKGYATELAKGILSWGFANLKQDSLIAVIDPRNRKSQEVVKRAGMNFIGMTWCYNKDINVYEIKKKRFNPVFFTTGGTTQNLESEQLKLRARL